MRGLAMGWEHVHVHVAAFVLDDVIMIDKNLI